MYEYLIGTLIEADENLVVLEVNGLGYRLELPSGHETKLPTVGQMAKFYTALVIKETHQTLYAFLQKGERDLFKKLITLSGIGPKTALSLIGHLSGSAFEEAVAADDIQALAKVPGIGKKTAQRLLIDLKGYFDVFPVVEISGSVHHEAIKALLNLGYSPMEAKKAIEKASADLPQRVSLSQLIQAALKARYIETT
ncbi:MAG: Holliday junction branch migration protein RuvA [Chlamydiia bacterium]|nr:Holliday junction branch migration protein RuvA [Chlamydiia bacterium]